MTPGQRGMGGRRNSYVKKSEEPEPTFKEKVWALVDDPTSSGWAKAIAVVIMSLIGVSCVTFCLETLPQFHRKDVEVWFAIEAVCIFFFTLEYVTRLLSCPKLCPFLKGALNIVDLVAIVPFYVELAFDSGSGGSSAVFRVVRLVRVFRVFKISRYVSWVKIFANAMYASAQPLGMLLFVMAIGCVVFSSAIYFAERGDWDETTARYMRTLRDGSVETSPYQSIPASFWWCIITMTTVGYGDDVPITFAGKLIAGVASLSGILVLAIPITVISTNFNYEFGRMKKRREAMRQKMMMFKRQFGTHANQQGLGVIKDEIDAMVRRNTTELMDDFSNVTQNARDELSQELYDLVQIAYRQRQRMASKEEAAAEAAAPAPVKPDSPAVAALQHLASTGDTAAETKEETSPQRSESQRPLVSADSAPSVVAAMSPDETIKTLSHTDSIFGGQDRALRSGVSRDADASGAAVLGVLTTPTPAARPGAALTPLARPGAVLTPLAHKTSS